MSINVNKETINLMQFVVKDKYTLWEVQDILVPDTKPDVMKVIRVEGLPVIQDVELKDGSMRISGEITYYIMYKSMDGAKVRGISMSYPFVQTITNANIKQDMVQDTNICIKNIIWSLPNERKISIKAEVVISYFLNKIAPIEIINEITSEKDIEIFKTQDNYRNVMAVKQDVISINEELMLPQETTPIAEILRVGADITNTDYKISYNKILLKGEIKLQIFYLKNIDTSELGVYNTQIPFAGMLEFDNINDNSKFDITYRLQNMQLQLSGIDSNTVTLTADVAARAIMYEMKDVEHIVDFYSTEEDYEYLSQDVIAIKDIECLEHILNLKETVGAIESDNKIVDYSIQTEGLNYKVVGQNLNVSGSIKIPVTFVNQTSNMLDGKTYELDVDTNIAMGREIDEKSADINSKILSASIMQAGSNVETNISMQIIVCASNLTNIFQIGDIIEGKNTAKDLDNMYVYIVKKGDTLWSIAKRYKTTVAKIANTNNIVDENRLNIGQKLLLIR